MPDWLNRLITDISALWQKLPTSQKWLVGGLSSALFLGLIGLSLTLYIFPSGEFLASGLSPTEVAQFVRFFDEKGVRYSLRDNGTSIYVYQDPYALMAEYAYTGQKKPLGGYSQLLGPKWGESSEQFKEKSRVAHQEELEMGIVQGSDRIKTARVYITLGKDTLFRSTSMKPTASVKVGTGGMGLEKRHVEGIQWLVASSVAGLQPADVKVIDESNQVLSGYEELSDTEKISNEQFRAQKAYEEKLKREIASILDPVVGSNENYAITAIVNLDYDKKQMKETFIDTEEPLEVTIKTEEMTEENQPAGGIPGTDSNNAQSPMQAQQPGGQSKLTQESREVEKKPRLERETVKEEAPGDILSQYVSITVNQRQDAESAKLIPRAQEELAALEKQLKTAVGHIEDSTRFQFSFREVAFDTSAAAHAEAQARSRKTRQNVESAVFLVFAVLLVGLFFYFLHRVFSLQPAERERLEELTEGEVGPPSEELLTELGLRALGEIGDMAPEVKRSRMMHEQVENFAREHPDTASQIVKSWLSE